MEDNIGGEGEEEEEEEYVAVLTFRQHTDNSDSETEKAPVKGKGPPCVWESLLSVERDASDVHMVFIEGCSETDVHGSQKPQPNSSIV